MATPEVFTRVAGIPVVQTAYDKVTDAYVAGKGYSSWVKFACDTVESSVQYVAATAQPLAQPIVGKLEKPLQAADSFACRQLDRLEESVPIISAPPEKVVNETKRYLHGKLVTGTETLTNSSIGGLVTSRMDTVLSVTENAIDFLLPDSEQVVPKLADEPQEPLDTTRFDRLSAISNKVSTRVRTRAVNHLSAAQQKAQESLEKLQASLEALEQAQAQLKEQRARLTATLEEQGQWLRSSVSEQSQRLMTAVEGGAQTLQTTAQTLHTTAQNALPTLPSTIHLPGGKTVELQALLAQSERLTNAARTAFATAAAVAQHLPANVQNRSQEALQFAKELTQLVHNVALGNDVTRAVLERATFLIGKLNTSTSFFADYVRSYFQTSTPQPDTEMDDETPVTNSSESPNVKRIETDSPSAQTSPVKSEQLTEEEEEEEEVEEMSEDEPTETSTPTDQSFDTDV